MTNHQLASTFDLRNAHRHGSPAASVRTWRSMGRHVAGQLLGESNGLTTGGICLSQTSNLSGVGGLPYLDTYHPKQATKKIENHDYDSQQSI